MAQLLSHMFIVTIYHIVYLKALKFAEKLTWQKRTHYAFIFKNIFKGFFFPWNKGLNCVSLLAASNFACSTLIVLTFPPQINPNYPHLWISMYLANIIIVIIPTYVNLKFYPPIFNRITFFEYDKKSSCPGLCHFFVL